jgi:hypothetical protein
VDKDETMLLDVRNDDVMMKELPLLSMEVL